MSRRWRSRRLVAAAAFVAVGSMAIDGWHQQQQQTPPQTTVPAAPQPLIKLPDACELLSSAVLRSTLELDMSGHSESISGRRCSFQTLTTLRPVKVVRIEYEDYRSPSAAQGLIKMSLESDQRALKETRKAQGSFDKLDPMPSVGANVHLLTSAGDAYSGPVARIQFALAQYLVTVDTEQIELARVKATTETLIAAIKAAAAR